MYSSAGQNMGTYEYQRWAQPPTEMMQEVLFRELRASGRYRSVNSLRSNAHGDYLLRGQLYDFKEVSGSPLVARVAVEFELRDTKTGTTVWTHYYAHDEPVSGKDMGRWSRRWIAMCRADHRGSESGFGAVFCGAPGERRQRRPRRQEMPSLRAAQAERRRVSRVMSSSSSVPPRY